MEHPARVPFAHHLWAKRTLVAVVLLTAALLCYSLGGLLLSRHAFPSKPWYVKNRAEMKALFQRMNASELDRGAVAPDLTLPGIVGNEKFQLSRHRDIKPVVLIFGSFTCNVFCSQAVYLEHLFATYKDRVEFVFIAVAEAGDARPDCDFLLENPGRLTSEELIAHRRWCLRRAVSQIHFSIPAYFDLPDEAACKAYSAFPGRLVIVDQSGRVSRDFGTGLLRGWDWGEVVWELEKLGVQGSRPDPQWLLHRVPSKTGKDK
jgi:hypothetical protein